jgi:hypothetical protein
MSETIHKITKWFWNRPELRPKARRGVKPPESPGFITPPHQRSLDVT